MTIFDAQGRPQMPEWHKDVNPIFMMQWQGHFFVFEGIDPSKPDVIFFRYKGPTKATQRRRDAAKH